MSESRPRPWEHLADTDRDGAYADLPAWERWWAALEPENAAIMAKLDDSERLRLYVVMAGLADGDQTWTTRQERDDDMRRWLEARDRARREEAPR
jgi:hypothetical protein